MKAEDISEGIDTNAIGKEIHCVDVCSSTNDLAWDAAEKGAPHGTVIFAGEQSSGRGRRGREWISSRESSLLCSFLLRPRISADRVPLVTALGALAVTDAAARSGVSARVRFPNDVYVGSRKLAGILAESRFSSSQPGAIVLGIGMNVNGHPPDFPATSLAQECGRTLDRTGIARHLVEAVDHWVSLLNGPLDPFLEAWRERSDLIGRSVSIRQERREYLGIVLDVHCLDGVRLRLKQGEERLFRGEHIEKLDPV